MSRDSFRQKAVEIAWRRYQASLRQGSVPCRADGDKEGQAENFRDSAERSEMRYEQVKNLLCDMGVPTIQFVTYRGFALHVDKLWGDHADETLRDCVRHAIQRWTSYGCTEQILRDICRKVFELEV